MPGLKGGPYGFDHALDSETANVGLYAEPNWGNRCSDRDWEVRAPKTERPINRLSFETRVIGVLTHALEMTGRLIEY